MAVRYLDQTDWLGEAEALDILINSDFFLTRIPIRGISDFEVKNRVSFSIINERQCCLQFGALTSEQQLLLDEFITKHTSGNS